MAIETFSNLYQRITKGLDCVGTWLPSLFLRLLLAWEFGEAGFAKFNGENWFAHADFPFPFNVLPASVNWNLALSFEILGAFALVLGLATRFFATSLFIITIVAIAAVHWPEQWGTLSELLTGYRISDRDGDGFGNYKLPVIFLVMLLPLILNGAGKLSLDHWLKKNWFKQ